MNIMAPNSVIRGNINQQAFLEVKMGLKDPGMAALKSKLGNNVMHLEALMNFSNSWDIPVLLTK